MSTDLAAPRDGRTHDFANALAALTFDSLPPHVVEHTKAVLYDALGAAIAATAERYPIGALLESAARQRGGTPEAQLIGTSVRTDCATAALLNGTLAYYCDIESHHPTANVHAIAVIGPAALAVGERVQASGASLLAAIIAGIEAASRVSYALGPAAQYARGFHPSSVAGSFGAAVAAGHLLELDAARLTQALGLVGNSASGLLSWVEDPTEQSRPFNIGLAAQHGVQAATMAALGMPGPPDVFGGKYTLGMAFSGSWDAGALLDGLGERYEVEELFFKRYASCVFIPAGVDGLLDVLASESITPADIDHIVLRPPRSVYHVIDGNPLRSHCAQYILAVAAHHGTVTFDDVINDRRRDERILSLSEQITLIGDEELDARCLGSRQSVGSKLEVVAKDGRRFEREVIHPRGAADNPLSKEELDDKVRRLTADILSPDALAKIRAAVYQLDEAQDVGTLARLLARSDGADGRR